MMLRRYGGLLLVAIISAAATYLAAYGLQRSARPSSSAESTPAAGSGVTDWLRLTPQQADDLRDIEAGFAADRAPLEAKVAAEREQLATMLEDPTTPNDKILEQVDNVIAAQNALERRVADLLVAMRPHLTSQQQKRLFERFATGVREGCGRHWRHGQYGDMERGQRGGPPPGRGPGWGRGRGSGFQARGRHHQQVTTMPTTQP
jgi:Spy/CpxP family protein refolding chaperone